MCISSAVGLNILTKSYVLSKLVFETDKYLMMAPFVEVAFPALISLSTQRKVKIFALTVNNFDKT